MNIDPLHILTFNMQAQPGTYALLLGSGVSRAAGIPTGWDLTLDLVRKLAMLDDKSVGRDPEDWFKAKYGAAPTYSNVVSGLASTTALQQQLLKEYFEPTEDEREQGLKLPTTAHRAIARLVRLGHFRVIVTTNFDRLMETALKAEGVEPVIIQHPDDIDGAPSFFHSKCTLIKVHGDYLDTRIRNSPQDLEQYDPRIDTILDRVFDDFGLLVCGWSAEYDVALARAVRRSNTRRYRMVWSSITAPKRSAEDLIEARSALSIRIASADDFFSRLSETLSALEDFGRPHPLSTSSSVALLKRYLSSDSHRIQLRDLLVEEAERCITSLKAAWKALGGAAPTVELVSNHLKRLEGASETLCALFATGSYFGRPTDMPAFRDALKLLAGHQWDIGGWVFWESLQKYPLLRLLYATGISATASGNYHLLTLVATLPTYRSQIRNGLLPLGAMLDADEVMDRDNGKRYLPGMSNRKVPFNLYLLETMKGALSQSVPDQAAIVDAFDLFEYMWSHVRYDEELKAGSEPQWAREGRFIVGGRDDLRRQFAPGLSGDWAPLAAGLFSGKSSQLAAVHTRVEAMLTQQVRGR